MSLVFIDLIVLFDCAGCFGWIWDDLFRLIDLFVLDVLFIFCFKHLHATLDSQLIKYFA